MDKEEKQTLLEDYLKNLGSVAVAFSAGVDSSYLLKVASDVLGDKAIAITVRAKNFPSSEMSASVAFCKKYGIRQIVVDFDSLGVESFCENLADRCYHCKKNEFAGIIHAAKRAGARYVVEGSNFDDLSDYRPGMRAIEELGVLSPLKTLAFTKADVRRLSRSLGLETWDKPAAACLASRFAYGERITYEGLEMVEKAEEYLKSLGFTGLRVRTSNKTARIELKKDDIKKLFSDNLYEEVDKTLKNYGFTYVSVDLGGYEKGNMNKQILK
ncbi:MAG: ATP-dependent sacrificial sulfur transferase LarE [Clostridia bacterium]|nr:ATP-dependent sacrificial sulfur transferase LarE [Clostridia bacterium]